VNAGAGVAPRALGKKISAALDNIPTAFSAAAGSRALTGLYNKGYSSLMVLNETNARISVATTDATTGPPSAATAEKVWVLAHGTASFDRFPVLDSIYIQSDDGSPITKGTVEVMVW
jgi:hypothetical protein